MVWVVVWFFDHLRVAEFVLRVDRIMPVNNQRGIFILGPNELSPAHQKIVKRLQIAVSLQPTLLEYRLHKKMAPAVLAGLGAFWLSLQTLYTPLFF